MLAANNPHPIPSTRHSNAIPIASPSVPWAMRFPTDPVARALSPALAQGGSLHWHDAYRQLLRSGDWARLAVGVPLRHPSQLYEALLELDE